MQRPRIATLAATTLFYFVVVRIVLNLALTSSAMTTVVSMGLAIVFVVLQVARMQEIRERSRLASLWETLNGSAPVGIFQTNANGRITYANPRWNALIGLPAAANGTVDWLEGVSSSDRQAVAQAWRDQLTGAPFAAQFRTMRLGATDTWVTGYAAPTRDSTGRINGFLGTVLDISEMKQQERELIASSKMSSLGEMAGGIAHEVNNPLMIIQAMADQLKRLCDRGELDAVRARSTAQQIEDTVRRIAKIVSGLRAFARNADRDPLALSSIGAIVDATLGLCQERFRSEGIYVTVSGPLDAELDCRAVQLSQVLLNLLNNAYDAIEKLPEKWISLGIESTIGRISISVTDSGRGIAPDVAAKMMQPFFTTKPVGRGTGLGLSISKGIVEDHGGKLELDMVAPHTRFVVTLPTSVPPGS